MLSGLAAVLFDVDHLGGGFAACHALQIMLPGGMAALTKCAAGLQFTVLAHEQVLSTKPAALPLL